VLVSRVRRHADLPDAGDAQAKGQLERAEGSAAEPLIRIGRNDYSIDPVFAGGRVEIRISQTLITAIVPDTGELAAQHNRIFAGSQTIVGPDHQNELEAQRQRRRQRPPGRCRAASPGRLRRADRMSSATSELAHLFPGTESARGGQRATRAGLRGHGTLSLGPRSLATTPSRPQWSTGLIHHADILSRQLPPTRQGPRPPA
jgi:hypothetical protein